MKTFFCWLIARAIETIIVLEIIIMAIVKEKGIILSNKLSGHEEAVNFLLISVAASFFFSGWIMIYTYHNIDEVLSNQFKWRHSRVDSFHYRLSYSWGRFQMVFVACALLFYILSMLLNFQL